MLCASTGHAKLQPVCAHSLSTTVRQVWVLCRTPTTLWSTPTTLWSIPTTLWSTPTTLWCKGVRVTVPSTGFCSGHGVRVSQLKGGDWTKNQRHLERIDASDTTHPGRIRDQKAKHTQREIENVRTGPTHYPLRVCSEACGKQLFGPLPTRGPS